MAYEEVSFEHDLQAGMRAASEQFAEQLGTALSAPATEQEGMFFAHQTEQDEQSPDPVFVDGDARRSRKRMRMAMVGFAVGSLSFAVTFAATRNSDEVDPQSPPTSVVDKEVEPTFIDPELCDFSAKAEQDPGTKIREYQECKTQHQLGLPGLTD